MSRADAVAHCKRAAGGAVVVIEAQPRAVWSDTAGDMVVIEDAGTQAAWDETRSALEREGVRIYVRGPLCYDPRPLGCRPRAKPETQPKPAARRVRAADG